MRADPAPAAEPLWARQAPGAARRKHGLRARWAGRDWSGFSEGPRGPLVEAGGRGGPRQAPLCLGLGMECGRISERGFVTGSLLPSRLSPRLVFKRERGGREWPPSRPPGLALLAGAGSVGEGRWTFLSIARFVYTFLLMPNSTSPAQGAPVPAQMLGGGTRLRCFDLLASEVQRCTVSMWLRKWPWPSLPLANGCSTFFPN